MLDLTLRDFVRGIRRYFPFVSAVLAIVVVGVFLPGEPPREVSTSTFGPQSGQQVQQTGQQVAAGAQAGTVSAQGTQVAGTQTTAGGPLQVTQSAGQAPDCDPQTGRIKFPTAYAPPCAPAWPKGADNGGATSQGVTKDKIIVALRECSTAQGQAVNAALGIDDTPEEVRQTHKDYADIFNKHYRLYGRQVEIVPFTCAGDTAEARKADAIHVATKIKAFASAGGPAEYIDELAARGVLCVSGGCYASAAVETYLRNKPYVWGWYITNTQAYLHRMEYIGKRLCGRPAKWAGDATYKARRRSFAVLSFNDAQDSYKSGAEFGVRELTKYPGADGQGCKADDLIFQTLNVQTAQEDATTIIARLKEKQITSVLYTGDPISLIVYTKEATKQNYFPEWIIGASVLSDTTFFGRLYDQTQWRNAFGLSWNPARVVRAQTESWALFKWHHNGKEPVAEDVYSVIFPNYLMLFTGLHMAGPKLTPETFTAGMGAYPPTPANAAGITRMMLSFGKHGLWQWEDFTAQDDATEIWWDPTASGEDENGNQGAGMVRYVDGGKRYMPGQRPTTEPKAFDQAGTTLIYSQRPQADAYPDYQHQHYE